MPIINLKKQYYPIYRENTYIEVSDEVAQALLELHRDEDRLRLKRHYHKAYYSLDAFPGFETMSIGEAQPSPEDLSAHARKSSL